MKLIDKIALNRLLKILTDFILGILKIFAPKENVVIKPEKKRPLKDLLDRIFK